MRVLTTRTGRQWVWTLRLVLIANLALGGLVGTAASAQAHRDGCHRWHSCPSDTGSYVCGDLGYYSECPGGGPSVPDEVEYDFTAPKAPKMSSPVARAKGVVTFTVKAERGSKIVVTDDLGDVAKQFTSNGVTQTVRLTGQSGERSYTATAMDTSGNESSESKTISVTADSTPPPAENVRVRAASAEDVSSSLSFNTEAGTTYDLAVTGKKKQHFRGTTKGSAKDLQVWIPNGTYKLALTLTDEVGNQRTLQRALKVAVSEPKLVVERLSPAMVKPVVLAVTAPARSTGVVRMAGMKDKPFEVAENGRAEVTLDLEEGDHAPARVELTDALGRTAEGNSPRLLVDSVKPALRVNLLAEAADHGLLGLSVLAERGTRVSVKASPQGQASMTAAFAGTGEPQAFERHLEEGDYTVVVIATDAAGNATTWTQLVKIVVPLSLADWLVILVGLLIAFVGSWFVWRRREQISAWRARRKAEAEERAAQRRRAEVEATHLRALQSFALASADHKRGEAAWQARRATLQELLDIATNGTNKSPKGPAGHKPRKGEHVLTMIQGVMVEQRSRQGQIVTVQVGSGTVVVSDQRITFIGDRSREWAFDKLVRKVDVGADTTMLTVTNRKTTSGVLYPLDSERNRVIIDAAVESATTGRRERAVARVRSLIAEHDRARPTPPIEPRPPQSV